jgi:hypothetical protein
MHERTDGQGAEHLAPPLVMTTPGEGLRAYLVPGLATDVGHTNFATGTPAELAVMVADFAARLALIDPESMPPGARLRLTVGVQPFEPLSDGRGRYFTPQESEVTRVASVNAAADVLLPGITPAHESLSGGSVHYTALAATPAGLPLTLFTSITPSNARTTDVAVAEAAAVAVDEAVRRDEGELVAGARALGHVMDLQPAGRMDQPGYVAAVCLCGERTEPLSTPDRARGAWRLHARAAVAAHNGWIEFLSVASAHGHVPDLKPAADSVTRLVTECACDGFQSAPGTARAANEAWRRHVEAMLAEGSPPASWAGQHGHRRRVLLLPSGGRQASCTGCGWWSSVGSAPEVIELWRRHAVDVIAVDGDMAAGEAAS